MSVRTFLYVAEGMFVLLAAVGVGMIYLPAGLIVAGAVGALLVEMNT